MARFSAAGHHSAEKDWVDTNLSDFASLEQPKNASPKINWEAALFGQTRLASTPRNPFELTDGCTVEMLDMLPPEFENLFAKET